MAAEPPAGGKRGIGDIIGGFVAGLYSVPEGIGYASLAGISPMLGIYAGMVPVAVAARFTERYALVLVVAIGTAVVWLLRELQAAASAS
jgi:SulP family sulfate permease